MPTGPGRSGRSDDRLRTMEVRANRRALQPPRDARSASLRKNGEEKKSSGCCALARPRTAPIEGDVIDGRGRARCAVCDGGVKSVRAGVFGTAALSLCFLMTAAASGHAQSAPPSAAASPSSSSAPLPGFVPPYEIDKIVRAAGFHPLTRPRREGTTYVVRALDFRGILMRVVVDARSGAIRAVNRIVPGPAPYGVLGMVAPPYGGPGPYGPPPYGPLPGPPPPYGAPPYGAPPGPPPYGPPPYGPPPYDAPPGYGMAPELDDPAMGPREADLSMPPPPSAMHSGAHPSAPGALPLPRPRPADLAAREAKPVGQATEKPAEMPAARPEAAPSAAAVTTPPASPPAAVPPIAAPAAAPATTPAPAATSPAKKPLLPPIQD